jgi:hypothetical protein
MSEKNLTFPTSDELLKKSTLDLQSHMNETVEGLFNTLKSLSGNGDAIDSITKSFILHEKTLNNTAVVSIFIIYSRHWTCQ